MNSGQDVTIATQDRNYDYYLNSIFQIRNDVICVAVENSQNM